MRLTRWIVEQMQVGRTDPTSRREEIRMTGVGLLVFAFALVLLFSCGPGRSVRSVFLFGICIAIVLGLALQLVTLVRSRHDSIWHLAKGAELMLEGAAVLLLGTLFGMYLARKWGNPGFPARLSLPTVVGTVFVIIFGTCAGIMRIGQCCVVFWRLCARRTDDWAPVSSSGSSEPAHCDQP